MERNSEKKIINLRIPREIKENLLKDFETLKLKRTGTNLEWERWLKRGDQYLKITFYADGKTNNESCMLINVLHPLVKQASMSIETREPKYVAMKCNNHSLPDGEHEFIVCQWNYTGILADTKLITIAKNAEIESELDKNLSNFEVLKNDEKDYNWEELNKRHQAKWLLEKEQFIEKSKKVIDFKRQSLSTNFRNQKLALESIIRNSSDENIVRMKKAQLENANIIYNRKIEELDESVNKIDITFKPIVYGVLKVE